MKLYEFEAKQLLVKYSIPVPEGILLADAKQTADVANKLAPPYALKAQVLVGGRQKAGGILFADSIEEAQKAASTLLRMEIKNLPVNRLLVEKKVPVKRELYVGVTVDRLKQSYVTIASANGGVDVEETASKNPLAINKILINPQQGFKSYRATAMAKKLGYCGIQLLELTNIIKNLYQASFENDAELFEINPLAELTDGTFTALDSHALIDDNALYRQREYRTMLAEREKTSEENYALKKDLSYIKLDGDIGVIANGAGLEMTTLDLINYYGGKPANFLDLGGGATIQRITHALQIVLFDVDTKTVLVNILGGMTHCDEAAQSIVDTLKVYRVRKPVIVRLAGTNQEEGKRILTEAGIQSVDSMEEAAKLTVETTKRG